MCVCVLLGGGGLYYSVRGVSLGLGLQLVDVFVGKGRIYGYSRKALVCIDPYRTAHLNICWKAF